MTDQPQRPAAPARITLPRHAVWRTDQTSEVMLFQWGRTEPDKITPPGS